MGSKFGFNLGKGNSNLGRNSGKGGPSTNEKDDKSDALKVSTVKIVWSTSLGNIPKVVAKVDRIGFGNENSC